jgi:precorrin-6x reductase
MRVLLLGGTAEGRELAAQLHPQTDVISSLAGRVPDPALPVGPVRIGGFGGVEGLRQWLRDNDITAVVDATHPFAATITAIAAAKAITLASTLLSKFSSAGNHSAKRAMASAANSTIAPCAKLKTPLALKMSTKPSATSEYSMPVIRPPNRVSRNAPMVCSCARVLVCSLSGPYRGKR